MKIHFGIGGMLMIAGMIVSDRGEVFSVYLWAALLHEVGHLMAAFLLKIKIREIRFEFSGARICTDEKLTSYTYELILALSGPFVSLMCWLYCLGAAWINGITPNELFSLSYGFLIGENMSRAAIGGFFALASLMQALTNLLPVRSFDGGRALYCALSLIGGINLSERVLTLTTYVSALILWLTALYLMLRSASGVGIFVFAACIFVGITDSAGGRSAYEKN